MSKEINNKMKKNNNKNNNNNNNKYAVKKKRKKNNNNNNNKTKRVYVRKINGSNQQIERKQLNDSMKLYLKHNPTVSATKAVKIISAIATLNPTLSSDGAVDDTTAILNRSFNSQIKIDIPLSIDAIYGWACGFVSYAYKCGYAQKASRDSTTAQVAYAFNFIVQQLLDAASNRIGNDSSRDKIPACLRDTMAALMPKRDISYPQGSISYSFKVGTSPTPVDTIPYPRTLTPLGNYRMWETTAADESGYTIMAPPSVFIYTPDVGAAAFNDMAGFIQNATSKLNKYSGATLVPFALKGSPLYRSASAYAQNSTVLGTGDTGGAFNSLASLELPFNESPSYSVFCIGELNNNRTFNCHHPNGGDGNYLSASQLVSASPDAHRNKIYPIFKPVDIMEFLHRFALVLVDIFQKASDDSTSSMQYADLGITYVDFAIMFYQQIMVSFADSQIRCQSLFPYRGATVQFTPFIIDSTQTASNNNNSLFLPKFINLNLQSLRARMLATTVKPNTGKGVQYNQRHWIPQWGQYTDWVFDPKDYAYINKSSVSTPIFVSTTDTFDLYQSTVNGKVVDMGNSALIFNNITAFNKILTTYSPFIQCLERISNEMGPSLIECIGDSYILKEVTIKDSDCKRKKDKDRKKCIDKKEKECKVGVTVRDKIVVAITSQKPVISELYSATCSFIRPEVLLFKPSGGNSGRIDVQTWQIFAHECYLTSSGSANSGDTEFIKIDILRNDYVANCTMEKNGKNSAFIDLIKHLDESGDGGLLDTAASVAGGVLQAFVGLAPLATKMLTFV